MNNRQIQREQQAGCMKLTTVNVYVNRRQHQFFMPLWHNEKGEAILPMHTLNKLLTSLNVQRGQTYTVG